MWSCICDTVSAYAVWERVMMHRAVAQGVSGNAANSGISVGDTVIYTSSFFGDELWPADKLGFSRSAIGACPSPVCFVYVSGIPYLLSTISETPYGAVHLQYISGSLSSTSVPSSELILFLTRLGELRGLQRRLSASSKAWMHGVTSPAGM